MSVGYTLCPMGQASWMSWGRHVACPVLNRRMGLLFLAPLGPPVMASFVADGAPVHLAGVKRRRAECVVCLCDLGRHDRDYRILHIAQCPGAPDLPHCPVPLPSFPILIEAAAATSASATTRASDTATAVVMGARGSPPADVMARMLDSAKRVWGKPKAPNVFERMMAEAAAAAVVARDEPGPAADDAEASERLIMRGRGGRGRGGGRGAGRSSGWQRGRGRSLPPHKFVSGTPFVVDGFMEGPKPGRLYFLTHFHADHYGGLSRRWAEDAHSKIYCSAITARLVIKRLGVPEGRVERLPMNTPVPVSIGESRATVQVAQPLLHPRLTPTRLRPTSLSPSLPLHLPPLPPGNAAARCQPLPGRGASPVPFDRGKGGPSHRRLPLRAVCERAAA